MEKDENNKGREGNRAEARGLIKEEKLKNIRKVMIEVMHGKPQPNLT